MYMCIWLWHIEKERRWNRGGKFEILRESRSRAVKKKNSMHYFCNFLLPTIIKTKQKNKFILLVSLPVLSPLEYFTFLVIYTLDCKHHNGRVFIFAPQWISSTQHNTLHFTGTKYFEWKKYARNTQLKLLFFQGLKAGYVHIH